MSETSAKLACRYFDAKVRTEVFEYALDRARAMWYREPENIVHLMYFPAAGDDESDLAIFGAPTTRFEWPTPHHTSRIAPEMTSSLVFYGARGRGFDEDPIGIRLKLDLLQVTPTPGELLGEYLQRSVSLRLDTDVIEAAITANLSARLGRVPILPSPDVKYMG